MRRLLALIVVVILGAGCTSADPGVDAGLGPVLTDVELVARFGNAVWRVEAEGCGWTTSGSAFAIDARHLVTNYHVTANDPSPMLRSRTGQRRQGRVVGSRQRPDVAVIEVDEDLPAAVGWAPTDNLRDDEHLVVMGYPVPATRFTASPGSIVSFQGAQDEREAILSDAAIARGNSGGPALRGDGTVAGVVTQMALDERERRRVAIIFTASTVQQTVEAFVQGPQRVLSSCGLGPDYVPPVPKDFTIPAPPPTQPTLSRQVVAQPPPTSAPDDALAPPPPTSTTSPPAPTTTRVTCPSARPRVTVDEVEASPDPSNEGWWEVRVRGTVTNDTSVGIKILEIVVRIEGDPPREASGFPDQEPADVGETVRWEGSQFVYSPASEPDEASVTRFRFEWTDSDYRSCPTT